MEILLWWLPPVVVTVVAMAWVAWLGRTRDEKPDRSDAAQARFAAAITKELPHQVLAQVESPERQRTRDRSTGIAVRPSQRPSTNATSVTSAPAQPESGDRRSA